MSKQQTKTHKLATAPQHVKILAGQWRGTKLSVKLQDDVRPTPSRVRETLFNWLQPYIVGSRCLDLFAGSGALGFEAVSRGARSSQLVDKDQHIVNLLLQQATKLNTDKVSAQCDDVFNYLSNTQCVFDIIFLDPPFSKINPFDLLDIIQQQQLLMEDGLIYVEYASKNPPELISKQWQWWRQSTSGEVEFGLLKKSIEI